jgi:hypothetical protein
MDSLTINHGYVVNLLIIGNILIWGGYFFTRSSFETNSSWVNYLLYWWRIFGLLTSVTALFLLTLILLALLVVQSGKHLGTIAIGLPALAIGALSFALYAAGQIAVINANKGSGPSS